jgi:hypothetical protein
MKKLYAILLCLLGSTFLLHAETLEKQIQVASFNRIDASSIYHIEVQQGSSRAVDLVYSEKLQSYLEVYVSNGTLYLRLDLPLLSKHLLLSEEKIQVKVQTNKLTSVVLSGAASISVEGEYEADRFTLDLSGASQVEGELQIDADRFDYALSGASEASVRGDFDVVRGEVSGASSFYLYGDADELDIECSGASNVVYAGDVSEQIKVDCSGASATRLTGKTREIVVDCSGASTVEAAEMIAEDGTANASGLSSVRIYGSQSLNLKSSSNSKIKYYGDPKKLSQPQAPVQRGN